VQHTRKRIQLDIHRYAGGHSGVSAVDGSLPRMCNNDYELIIELVHIVAGLRNKIA
jgi:hypothetical protein